MRGPTEWHQNCQICSICILQVLKAFARKVLDEASKKNIGSVAFPAIGCGNLAFPPDVVAKCLFETVDDFSSKNSGTSISEVRFVIYEKDTATYDVSVDLCLPSAREFVLT